MSQHEGKLSNAMEENDVYRRDNCRLCGSQNLELVLSLPSIPFADNYVPASHNPSRKCYPMELNLCKDCGLVFLRHVVNSQLIYPDYVYETTSSPGLVEHFKKYAENVLNQIKSAKGKLVVELGSNDGTL